MYDVAVLRLRGGTATSGGPLAGIEAPPGAGLVYNRDVLPAPESQEKSESPEGRMIELRRRRWARKWHADGLRKLVLFDPDVAEHLGVDPKHFSSAFRCHRHARRDEEIKIDYISKHQKAVIHAQFTCASDSCPLCAAKKAVKRREEIRRGGENAINLGYDKVMITLTVRHGIGDNLKNILDIMSKSLSQTISGRSAQYFNKKIGKIGHIRLTEITYGQNGWHPHFHIMFIVKQGCDKQYIKEFFADRWIRYCIENGLPEPIRDIACNVQDAGFADDYFVKWGLEDELSSGDRKKGKNGSRTPWELLDDSINGDKQAGVLYLIYCDAIFGKKLLFWSQGLKQKLGIEDVSDKALVDEVDEESTAETLIELDDMQVYAIVAMKMWCKILEFAEQVPNDLQSYIAIHVDMYYNKNPAKRKWHMKQKMKKLACSAG